MSDTNESNYKIQITAGLINDIFCNETGDVGAILASNDLHQVIPLFRDWMRRAIRHPDGTHMTPEEADAIFDNMPAAEYFGHIRDISGVLTQTFVSTMNTAEEDTTEPQESA